MLRIKILFLLFCGTVAADQDLEQLQHIKLNLWPQAYRTQDVELLASILHLQFQMTDAKGRVSTRSEELSGLKDYQWNPENFVYHIERLEVFNQQTAVISGRGETDTYSYRSSNVLIKEHGRWQAILSHVSGYQQK